MNNIWILAEAADGNFDVPAEPADQSTQPQTMTKADPNAAAPKADQRQPLIPPWALIPIMILFVYLILFRGPRKKQQQHKQMMQSLKKNDRVRTIGGIIGTIVDIKDDEITLKIDESNNTKIKIAPSAVGKNISQNKD